MNNKFYLELGIHVFNQANDTKYKYVYMYGSQNNRLKYNNCFFLPLSDLPILEEMCATPVRALLYLNYTSNISELAELILRCKEPVLFKRFNT